MDIKRACDRAWVLGNSRDSTVIIQMKSLYPHWLLNYNFGSVAGMIPGRACRKNLRSRKSYSAAQVRALALLTTDARLIETR
jgi:hypothetical protein